MEIPDNVARTKVLCVVTTRGKWSSLSPMVTILWSLGQRT